MAPYRSTIRSSPKSRPLEAISSSTFPLSNLGLYTVLSGTSMATPYISGCYALIKSQFPDITPREVKAMLQKTATPGWLYNTAILSATAQQGAGAVNLSKALTSETDISPSSITVADVTKTE